MRDTNKKKKIGNGVVDSILPPPPPPPPDDLRCKRNDGRGWRCKELRFEDKRYCEKHYSSDLKKRVKAKFKGVVEIKRKRKRIYLDSSEDKDEDEVEDDDDEDEVEEQQQQHQQPTPPPQQQQQHQYQQVETTANENKKMKRVSDIKKSEEEYTISELVSTLKTAFRSKDFEEVERILKMREEKMMMEKEEAEKKAVQITNLLGVSGANCALLSNELFEKKKEITAVQGNLEKLEIEKISIEKELQKYKRLRDEFKERVIQLEEEQRNACERERRSNETINELKQKNRDEKERLIELRTENIELQSAKRRAEYEVELWTERIKDLDIQELLESHVSQMEYVQPIYLSTQDPYAEERNKTESKPLDYGLTSARLSAVKVKEEALGYDGRFSASANPETVYYSSAKGYGVAKHAESDMQYGGKDRVQTVLSPSILGIMDTDSKMGTRPDESISKEILQRTCLKQSEAIPAHNNCHFSYMEIKEGLNCSANVYASVEKSRVARFPDSSKDQRCVTPNGSTGRDHVKEFPTPSSRGLISPQQTDDQRNRAEQIEMSGTSWKKSGSATAKNYDKEKQIQSTGSGCAGKRFNTVMKYQNYSPSKEASSMDPETASGGLSKVLYAIRKAKNKT